VWVIIIKIENKVGEKMFKGLEFMYDGIKSTEFLNDPLFICRIDNPIVAQIFGKNIELVTDRPLDGDIISLNRQVSSVMQFEITICKETPFTIEDRIELSRWLINTDSFKQFKSVDFPFVYECKAVGQPIFNNISNNNGYATLTMQCNAPYPYINSTIETFNLDENTVNTININNLSNVSNYYNPIMQIKNIIASTDIQLINLSDKGRLFQISNLLENEVITTDNLGYVRSNMKDGANIEYNRFKEILNQNFFRLVQGNNKIRVNGKCILVFEYKFPITI